MKNIDQVLKEQLPPVDWNKYDFDSMSILGVGLSGSSGATITVKIPLKIENRDGENRGG